MHKGDGVERETGPNEWWRDAAAYQIYPRSFQDSNRDGVGDLRGIIDRLDYLSALGVDALWISPFFESPQCDLGYDVSDFRAIAPEYGTMEDCMELIRQVHARGMKIIFDLVLNHTSDRHRWFIESRSSRENPKRDWYVWRDGRKPGGKEPPNNWQSKVTGRGWQYDKATDQWYWAAFLPFQPDLNYRNPEVRREMLRTVEFWLERGVDGFRLDIIGSLFEDAEFRDNPPAWNLLPTDENPGALFRSTVMTENLPETLEFMKELRRTVERFTDPPRYLVGETFGGLQALRRFCGEPEAPGLHSVFLFSTLGTPLRARPLRRLIGEFERWFPEPLSPTLVFGNHDVMRRRSALGGDEGRARASAFLQFTLRGVPFIYNGEELGMSQSFFRFESATDPVAHRFAFLPAFLQRLAQRLLLGRLCRDGCRTPMQWSGQAPGYGFTDAASSWLPIPEEAARVNVEAEERDPDSMLSLYRRLLSFRRAHRQLSRGALALEPAPRGVLAYSRTLEGLPALYAAVNLSRRTVRLRLPGKPVFFTRPCAETPAAESCPAGDVLELRPWEGVILERE
jgi:alpha-glucosidase